LQRLGLDVFLRTFLDRLSGTAPGPFLRILRFLSNGAGGQDRGPDHRHDPGPDGLGQGRPSRDHFSQIRGHLTPSSPPFRDSTRPVNADPDPDPEDLPGGDTEAPPEDWPGWCDEWVWEPSDSDRQWWAQQQDARERGAGYDQRAGESRALASHERGLLIPRDLAEDLMATSLVGHDG
jgi:hypothetical protein